MRSKLVLALMVSFPLLTSCGAQQGNPNADKSTISQNGCTIDLSKVCQAFIDQPAFTLNGADSNLHRLQENSTRHVNLELTFKMPNGDLIGTAQCQFDTLHRRVAYARLLPGPPITAAEVEYVKSRGWCADQKPDYGKAMSWSELRRVTSGASKLDHRTEGPDMFNDRTLSSA
jgi:hypothetical protein